MELLNKVNSIIKKLEKYRAPKTISKQSILQELESVAKLFLDLDCISDDDKVAGNKLWDISQKNRQPKDGILKVLRSIKKVLSSYDIKIELENQRLEPGKVILFTAGQNYSAYDQLKSFFASAVNAVDIIDPYLNPDTFQILKNISKRLNIRLITSSSGFYNGSKTDFNKFKKEYSIETKDSKIIHDRFFIIDDNGYFSGSSLHGVGNKLSAIAFMNKGDTKILQKEFNKIWNQSKKIQ